MTVLRPRTVSVLETLLSCDKHIFKHSTCRQQQRKRMLALISITLANRKNARAYSIAGHSQQRIASLRDIPFDAAFHFRFLSVEDILLICSCLEVPSEVITANGDKAPGWEAFAMLLMKLSYPTRLLTMNVTFGRSIGAMSGLISTLTSILHDRWKTHVNVLNTDAVAPKLAVFREAVHSKGGNPLLNVWGFIDGTLRPCARPTRGQQTIFNGKDKQHGLKYQGIMTPDGIFRMVLGPFAGRKHDSRMLRESGLLQQLESDNRFVREDGTAYQLYGDPAYPVSRYLKRPYKGARLTAGQQAFNSQMSRVRECVEWGFGNILNLWQSLELVRYEKFFESAIARRYQLAAILTNVYTCMYPERNNVAQFFEVQPPSLQEYLSTL